MERGRAAFSCSRRLVLHSYETSSSRPTPAKRAESRDPITKNRGDGSATGSPRRIARHRRAETRFCGRGVAPRGDDPSRRNNTDHIRSLIHFSNSPFRSRGASLRPGAATLLHSPRIEGWAERRETFGCSAEHPCGMPSCVKDARERAYDAARQAPSEAPCVP
jgi:hypothetical protein